MARLSLDAEKLGMLDVGRLADVVAFDRDDLTCAEGNIAKLGLNERSSVGERCFGSRSS